MADEIAQGSVVRLKSGGPAMTVTSDGERFREVDGTDDVIASWFNSNGMMQTSKFPRSTLQIVELGNDGNGEKDAQPG